MHKLYVVEQTRQPVAEVNTDVVPSLAHVEVTEVPLAKWLDAATSGATMEARDSALSMLASALSSLPSTEANADALVQLLETDALAGLETREGQSVKELAVEALLRLGFPHALRVHPDQLDWARSLQRRRSRVKWLRVAAGVLTAGNLGLWSWLVWNGSLRFLATLSG